MNNYFVGIAARAFTDVEERIQERLENKEAIKQQEQLTELNKVKHQWND